MGKAVWLRNSFLSLLLRIRAERIISFGVGRDRVIEGLALGLRVILAILHGLVDHVDRFGPHGLDLLVGEVVGVIESEWVACNITDAQGLSARPAGNKGRNQADQEENRG